MASKNGQRTNGTRQATGARSTSGRGTQTAKRRTSQGANRSASSATSREPGATPRRRGGARKQQRIDFWHGVLGLAGICLVLNVLAWVSPGFCDWYTRYVFPIWLNTYGRITAVFPFSVGEVMLILAVILLVLALIAWIPMVLVKRRRKAPALYFGIRTFYRVLLGIVLNVSIVMTLNCFIMYHCSPLDANPRTEKRDYTTEELLAVYNHVVAQLDELAFTFERDELDNIIIDKEQMEQSCIAAIKRLGARYPKLAGWYPQTKTIRHSDLMSQAYTSGVYFPFSLEANVNGIMYIANYPSVICHELSHLRGYIYENEANFLAFVACVESEDPFLRYSGYLSVLYYLEEDIYAAEQQGFTFPEYTCPDRLVYWDNCFLTPEAWEEVEEDAVISTETVDQISDAITDTTLQINGVESGIASYSEVVELLLEYYDGVLYSPKTDK